MNLKMNNLQITKAALSTPSQDVEVVPAPKLAKDQQVAVVRNSAAQTSTAVAVATPKSDVPVSKMINPMKLEQTYNLIAWRSMLTTFNPGVVSHAILTKDAVLNDARKAGLSDREVSELRTRLDRMGPEEQSAELAFLNKNVTTSPNTDRALRTYLKLGRMKDEHPERITNDIVHTLTRGVAEPRTNSSTGQEGVLGQQQALDAAEAMTKMSKTDYDNLKKTLGQTGMRLKSTKPVETGQVEKALILKSVAARKDSFTNPTMSDKLRNAGGSPSLVMSDIMTYGGEIRGKSRDSLIDSSTVLDLRDDGRAGALQQRFIDSCAPTTAQIARAEADPIYAWKLHKEQVHSLDHSGTTGKEQKELLELGGGSAAARQPKSIWDLIVASKGVPAVGTERILDSHVGPYSNINYKFNGVMDSKSSRTNALNQITDLVERGIDVPVAVAWNGGGGHVMLITDVRGSGDSQRFLITDPLNGTSTWVTRKAIVDGNTNFIPGSQGRLNEFFSPAVPDYGSLGIEPRFISVG